MGGAEELSNKRGSIGQQRGGSLCGGLLWICTDTVTTERLSEVLRANNVEVRSVENKIEENEDVFYVCKSLTSGKRLLTWIGWFISTTQFFIESLCFRI